MNLSLLKRKLFSNNWMRHASYKASLAHISLAYCLVLLPISIGYAQNAQVNSVNTANTVNTGATAPSAPLAGQTLDSSSNNLNGSGANSSGANSPLMVSPNRIFEVLSSCSAASNAGFQYHRGFLLNPKDFQLITLQDSIKPFLSRLNTALAEQGTELVVLLMPPRGALFPELSAETRMRYLELQAALQATGLSVAPLILIFAQYPQDFFFTYDHHWTPFGASETARLLAGYLDSTSLPTYSYVTSTTDYAWTPSNSRLKSLSSLCNTEFFEADNSYASGFATTLEGAGLFSDVEVKTVITGTSNSESTTLNFSGFLSQYSGLAVKNYSFASSGGLGSLLNYLHSEDFIQNKPRYIIWEFLANPQVHDYFFNDISYHRQMIASIYGSCVEANSTTLSANGLAQQEIVINASNASYITLFDEQARASIAGTNSYLRFEFLEQTEFQEKVLVEIAYADGTVDFNHLKPVTQTSSAAELKHYLYLEFLDIPQKVQAINISFPQVKENQQLKLDAQLCNKF